MNKWLGVGRLTRDVELRFTPNGKGVANFTVAINRPYKNQNNEYEADFINVKTFRNAENIATFCKKGSLVGVEGRIETRSYDKDGQRVFVTEINADNVQFLDTKGKTSNDSQKTENKQSDKFSDDPFSGDNGDFEGELPF